MQELYDTHCHLDYFEDPDQIIQNAKNKNVKFLNSICVEIDKFENIFSIVNRNDNVFCSIGQHPCNPYAGEESLHKAIINKVRNKNSSKIVAIGETGLDYYKKKLDKFEVNLQKDCFISQIEASIELDLPLVIHQREAENDMYNMLSSYRGLKGVMHCFTSNIDFMQKSLDLGFYISISGIVTFKNAKNLQDLIKYIPIEKLLIETDAPYLAPSIYRSKRNEPEYIIETAKFMSEILGFNINKITTENALKLFLF
jgi:TatD DNase family protein